MNFRKLITYLTMGTAAAMPLAVAQNPTILQGSYISNVFGNSNFIKNPNAQTNIADVTVSNATVTRSTTTPLVATSEFLVTTSTATGLATWSTRTFDGGMKGQNCEARFTYRGFSVGSTTAQILQGANVVAQLTLTPSTDPRIASINFPCGDLSAATTFRLQQATASLTGTNEIGAIYVGLATNMANVAQAEVVMKARKTTAQSIPDVTQTKIIYDQELLDVYGEYDPTTAVFTAKRAGWYQVEANFLFDSVAWTATKSHELSVYKNGTLYSQDRNQLDAAVTDYKYNRHVVTLPLVVGDTVAIYAYQNRGAATNLYTTGFQFFDFSISRFPSSSELVVTPERQNVFGGIRTLTASGSFSTASTTNTQITGLGNFTAVGSATSAGSMQFTMPTVPVGTYKLDFFVLSEAIPAAANQRTDCIYTISDGSDIYTAAYLSSLREGSPTDAPVQGGVFGSAVVRYNSVQTNKQFTVQVRRAGTGGTCASYGSGVYSAYFTITPLDQSSNSALYVEGPVKASATGAAIPSGYQHEGVTAVTSSLTNQSQGVWKTGTGLTLQPGVWLIRSHCTVGGTAPELITCGISKTANSAGIDDDLSHPTNTEFHDKSNTAWTIVGRTDGYFRITTATTFYPAININTPVSSTYNMTFVISAIRLN